MTHRWYIIMLLQSVTSSFRWRTNGSWLRESITARLAVWLQGRRHLCWTHRQSVHLQDELLQRGIVDRNGNSTHGISKAVRTSSGPVHTSVSLCYKVACYSVARWYSVSSAVVYKPLLGHVIIVVAPVVNVINNGLAKTSFRWSLHQTMQTSPEWWCCGWWWWCCCYC